MKINIHCKPLLPKEYLFIAELTWGHIPVDKDFTSRIFTDMEIRYRRGEFIELYKESLIYKGKKQRFITHLYYKYIILIRIKLQLIRNNIKHTLYAKQPRRRPI